MSSKPKDVDEYIRRAPKNVQRLLRAMRETIRKAAPGAVEVISYGIPAYKQGGMLAWFAAHANHVGSIPALPASRHSRKSSRATSTQRARSGFR